MRAFLDSLRQKLVRVHQRGQACVATVDDFTVEAFVPDGQTLLDRV